jgi:hypothetical protein
MEYQIEQRSRNCVCAHGGDNCVNESSEIIEDSNFCCKYKTAVSSSGEEGKLSLIDVSNLNLSLSLNPIRTHKAKFSQDEFLKASHSDFQLEKNQAIFHDQKEVFDGSRCKERQGRIYPAEILPVTQAEEHSFERYERPEDTALSQCYVHQPLREQDLPDARDDFLGNGCKGTHELSIVW